MIDTAKALNAIEFQPIENPDWDHARERRLALRTPGAEFCQSSLTRTEADGFAYPVTDYAYEGLLTLVNGENWKSVDRIGFQLRGPECPLDVTAMPVEATPERVTYRFASSSGTLDVCYRLLEVPDAKPGASALTLSYRYDGDPVTLLVKPIFDLRHMYYFSDPDAHQVHQAGPRMLTVNNKRWVAISSDTDMQFEAERHTWELFHRMGSGEREVVEGAVYHKREWFRGAALGTIALPLEGEVTLSITVAQTEEEAIAQLASLQTVVSELATERDRLFASYVERFPGLSPEAVFRIYVMAEKFGMPVGGHLVPEGGGWWFRTPWFRSIFEGFLFNQKTLVKLGRQEFMEGAIRLALRYQDPETGRLPNRIPEIKADYERWDRTGSLPAEYYQSSDIVMGLFSWLADYLAEIRDAELLDSLKQGFLRAFRALRSEDRKAGTPVIAANGLLLTLPSHSWMNGRRAVRVEGIHVGDLPQRVDRSWQVEEILRYRDAHYAWERYQTASYYLPEVNAQWIRMLEVGARLAIMGGDIELHDEIVGLQKLAIANYKKVFWNPGVGYLYNLITHSGRPDPMISAPGLEAVVLLGSRVFSRKDLEQVWHTVRDSLLVTRNWQGQPAAFGILAKDSSARVFFGDEQYHEAVCWPRETPYLISLLRELGETPLVEQLLQTNLAHQMEEGVVFYHHEILSLPEGRNPSPSLATGSDPVPVKNPMQWWSQWCDPYLERE